MAHKEVKTSHSKYDWSLWLPRKQFQWTGPPQICSTHKSTSWLVTLAVTSASWLSLTSLVFLGAAFWADCHSLHYYLSLKPFPTHTYFLLTSFPGSRFICRSRSWHTVIIVCKCVEIMCGLLRPTLGEPYGVNKTPTLTQNNHIRHL